MDLVAFGLTIRALRRRRGWRQVDLARASRVSQSLVSAVERGHGDRAALRTLIAIAGALDARLNVQLRWRGGDVERLVDSDHAALAGRMSGLLKALDWDVRVEVTYATARSTGSIDILAWHAASRTILVIEVKTEITSAEATLRKLDEKARIAPALAQVRFGWNPAAVGRVLVVEEASTARRRIDAHAALFDAALPASGRNVAHWLREPSGDLAGRYFLSASTPGAVIRGTGGRHRVRRPTDARSMARRNVKGASSATANRPLAGQRTTRIG